VKKTVLLSSILVLIYTFSFSQNEGLIPNGDFEKGNVGFSSDFSYDSVSVSPGSYAVAKNASNFNGSFSPIPDHTTGTGNYLIVDVDDAEDKKIWRCTVPVEPNAEYLVEVWVANLNTGYRNPAEVGLLINDTVTGAPYPLPDASNSWEKLSWQWLSGTSKTATICLINKNPVSDGNDVAIDDIKLILISKPKPVVVAAPVNNCPAVGDTINNLVHFPFNESKLTEYSKKRMEVLLELLNDCRDMKLKIQGHADKFGGDGYNDKLSVQRAKQVYDYLLTKGVNATRLTIQGLGEKKPIYFGSSTKEYVKNRRIEFVVY